MKCYICNKKFDSYEKCRRHQRRFHKIELKHICKFCNKEYKSGQSLGAHIICCKLNPNRIIIQSFKGKKHSKETKEKISKSMSLNNKGGRCKWYIVNDQNVQGTWERDLAIKLNLLGIKWQKLKVNNYKESFYYEDDIKHFYTPDFYISEFDIYLEVKGYWFGNDKRKMELVLNQNPKLKKRLFIIEKEKFGSLLLTKNKNEFFKCLVSR